jgi:hypothetical protein
MRSGSPLFALFLVAACGGGEKREPEPQPAPDPCVEIEKRLHFTAGADEKTRRVEDAAGAELARVVRTPDHLHVIDPQGVPMVRIRFDKDIAVLSDAAGRQIANLSRAEFPDLVPAAVKAAELSDDLTTLLLCDYR